MTTRVTLRRRSLTPRPVSFEPMPTSTHFRLLCALAFAAVACGKHGPAAPPPEPSEHSLSGLAAQHVAVLPTYSVRVMPGLEWAGAIGRHEDVKRALDADILAALDERGIRKDVDFSRGARRRLQAQLDVRRRSVRAGRGAASLAVARASTRSFPIRSPRSFARSSPSIEDARLVLAPVELRFEKAGTRRTRRPAPRAHRSATRQRPVDRRDLERQRAELRPGHLGVHRVEVGERDRDALTQLIFQHATTGHSDSRRRHRSVDQPRPPSAFSMPRAPTSNGTRRSPGWPASRGSAIRFPMRRSTRSSAPSSRSRARSRRRSAKAIARSTSRSARRSTSTRTCGPRTRSLPAADMRISIS